MFVGTSTPEFGACKWPILCAVVALAAPGSLGGHAVSATLLTHHVRTDARCTLAAVAESPNLSAPPTRKGALRTGHFRVDQVVVAVKRARAVGRSRIGGLYGP